MAATFHKYPKQEGNDCKECGGSKRKMYRALDISAKQFDRWLDLY